MNTFLIALNLLTVNPQPVEPQIAIAPVTQCPIDPTGMYQDFKGGN